MGTIYALLFMLVGGLASYGVTWYNGYKVCNQGYQIKLLKAEVKRLTLSKAYLESSIEFIKEIDKENAEIILENTSTITKLQKEIEDEKLKNSTSSRKCVIDRTFLRDTNSLK